MPSTSRGGVTEKMQAEALYNPLLRFCEYERTEEKNVRFRLLWGLIRYDRWRDGSNTGLLFFNVTRERH